MAKPASDWVDGKRSPEWAFFSRLGIRNRSGEVYLRRLRIVSSPWFGVFLHRIYSPDEDRAEHDHPWDFWSFILCGWYQEHCEGVYFKRVWCNFKRAEDQHRITWLSRRPVWTLVFHGRRRRVWGFHTDRGWVAWDKYEDLLGAE